MDTFNGCGAMSGWLRWVRPPHHRFFHRQCLLHDELYAMGGGEADRRRADVRLFNDMIVHSMQYYQYRSRGALVWFILLSYAYYKAVRWFGRGSFNYHKER